MNEQEIINEAKSWKNTKWMHGVALKGYGVDCVQFIVALAKTFGWLPEGYKTLKYNRDFALHNSDSILLEEIENYCVKVEDDFRIGDILIFNFGKCGNHAGIYIGDERMIHAHIKRGVEEIEIKKMKDKYVSAWRFKGLKNE